MDEFPNTNGYSFSWTQPYLPTSYNPFYQTVRAAELELELDRLDAVDLLVDQMDSYPDAQQIITRVMENYNDNTKD
jgi:hypothetical protein